MDQEKIIEDLQKQINKSWPFKDKCNEIADLLYYQYIYEENDEGCGDLMLEWIKSRFWGLLVRDHIPIFEEIHQILTSKKNIDEKNRYTYGDVDVSVWVEKVKNPKDMKVIASTRHCSGADDNTHLYILKNSKIGIPEFDSKNMFLEFKCRTVWSRQNKRGGYRVAKSKEHPNGWFSWGDDRDIKLPSINTYRERDFNFSYGDCRDKGHVFTFKNFSGPELDHPDWHENRISHSLWCLRSHLEALKDYDINKC